MVGHVDAAEVRDQLLAEVLDAGKDTVVSFDEYATMRRLGVGRAQLREALTSLSETGLIRRAPRTGTSLTNPQFYTSVADQATMDHSDPVPVRYETIGIERLVPTDHVSTDLTGEPGATLTRVERRCVVNGRAAEHWTVWTTLDLPDEVLLHGFPIDRTWYQVVSDLTGERTIEMRRTTVNYRAATADLDVLDVALGAPLRFISRRLDLPDGRPLDRAWGRVDSQLIISSERFTVQV